MNNRLKTLTIVFIKESMRNKIDIVFSMVMPLLLSLFFIYGLKINSKNIFSLLITMSIISGTIVSLIWDYGRYKKTSLLKKIFAAPVQASELMTSLFAGKLLINTSSIVIVSLFIELFTAEGLKINWPIFILVVLCGSISMVGISQIILFLFRGLQSSINGATFIIGVMLFLSSSWSESILGGFSWIRKVIPAKYIVDGINYSTAASSITLMQVLTSCGYITAFGVLMIYALSPINTKI